MDTSELPCNNALGEAYALAPAARLGWYVQTPLRNFGTIEPYN
ncbi:MAG: hypothetical protein ACRDHG_04570 [Anaerolineales bacterium]